MKESVVSTDWLSTGLQVAEVAANVIGRLLGEDGAAPTPPYASGSVQWYFDNSASRVWAFNSGNKEVGLNYAVASPDSSLSVLQPLPAHESYDATADFAAFTQGQLAVAPTPALPGAPEGLERIVTFTIGALALGITARILTGVEASVGRDQRSGLYTAKISSPTVPLRATVKATDVRGNTVSASGSLGATSERPRSGSAVLDIDLPPGVDLSPVIQNLFVEIETPAALFEQATAERRKLLVKGQPRFVKTPAGAAGGRR
jgi:hypothetical protein